MEDTMELARFDANTTRLDILQNAVDELLVFTKVV
jgi:hypothetical protein